MTGCFYRGASAAIVMCSITDESSIKGVLNWKNDLDVKLGTNVPVILVVNKVNFSRHKCSKIW